MALGAGAQWRVVSDEWGRWTCHAGRRIRHCVYKAGWKTRPPFFGSPPLGVSWRSWREAILKSSLAPPAPFPLWLMIDRFFLPAPAYEKPHEKPEK